MTKKHMHIHIHMFVLVSIEASLEGSAAKVFFASPPAQQIRKLWTPPFSQMATGLAHISVTPREVSVRLRIIRKLL